MEPDEELIETLPGDLRRIARVAGLEAALKISKAFRGRYLYVQGLEELERQVRDERIRADYDSGVPVRNISGKFGLTTRAVWKILSSPQEGMNPLAGRLRDVKKQG
jgi:Mor family transcriptional regulator